MDQKLLIPGAIIMAGVIVAAVISLKSTWTLNRKIRELQTELKETRKGAVEKEPEPVKAGKSYEAEDWETDL